MYATKNLIKQNLKLRRSAKVSIYASTTEQTIKWIVHGQETWLGIRTSYQRKLTDFCKTQQKKKETTHSAKIKVAKNYIIWETRFRRDWPNLFGGLTLGVDGKNLYLRRRASCWGIAVSRDDRAEMYECNDMSSLVNPYTNRLFN